jgi:ribosomal protein L18
MNRIPRTHSRDRASHLADDPGATLRDRMLVALTNKSVMLQVVEATHGAASWSQSACGSSQRELQEGLDLIEAEKSRLAERLQAERARRPRLPASVEQAACDASIERLLCRLQELADHREHLAGLAGRIRAEVDVESIEWQRPLTLQDGSVVGFVDLWATLRVTSYRVSQGNDPADPEQRLRYEGYNVHHLIRSVALFVEPTVPSLSGLVRQVRYAQAYAKNALPVLVTCQPTATELLAQQGIPTYVWSPDVAPVLPAVEPAVASRRVRRATSVRRAPAPEPSQPRLPSPRPSLPPAPLA